MKINNKILSIPPYLSTSWKNIASLHVEPENLNYTLVVTLTTGSRIEIPQLEGPLLEAIFTAHSNYLEQDQQSSTRQPLKMFGQGETASFGLPIRIAPGGGDTLAEGLAPLIGHNPEQAEAPELPEELLNKISSIAKIVAADNPEALPQPEPHCNCPYCQIARAIQKNINPSNELPVVEAAVAEEEVLPEDLNFSEWFIEQTADNLYSVINPLDQKEHYSVYLGKPIGCTCGIADCEHVRAVLRS